MMDKKQTGQYHMVNLINSHFNDNAAVWSSNVLISDIKAAFADKLHQIDAAGVIQTEVSAGATMAKARLRKDLEAKAMFISRAICAYISLNPGQVQLYQTVFITRSVMSKLREADLLLYAENLDEAALSILDNLAPYGVSEATITALVEARTSFFEMMKTPREITTSRREATAAISVLLREAVALLKNTMDRLVDVLEEAKPDFVNIYRSERRIHHLGSHTMSLEITTLNAADSTPLAEAKIEIVGTKIRRVSTKKGLNRVRNLKEANYILSVSHPDFAPQMIPFSIINHQTTQVVVEMSVIARNEAITGQ